MGRTQTAVGKAVRVALALIGVGVAGYLAMLVLLYFAMREPYPFLDVSNESGRPLLIERADTVSSPGVVTPGVLAWRTKEGWHAGGQGCEQAQLVARDVQGTVVARRTGTCRGDTWSITAEGLSAAPRYRREPVPHDHVEVRLVVSSYGTEQPVVAWWRTLPQTLERAKARGLAAGVTVHGPFLEDHDLTMYLRGPDAATVLDFARTQVMRPSPGRVYAYVGTPSQPAPQTGQSQILEPAAASTASTR